MQFTAENAILSEEIEMKTAEHLYELSLSSGPQIVRDILKNVKTHMIVKCQEYASQGGTCYEISLRRTREFVKPILLDECIKLVKEFEDKGYLISIDDCGNGYWLDYTITISWNGHLVKKTDSLRSIKHLYDTKHGLKRA